jgi:SAM-dependent methyltransferase
MVDAYTDRTRLTELAYADSGPLSARGRLYDYEVEPFPLVDWVLSHVSLPAEGAVLDVGCGPGQYLATVRRWRPRVATIGLDLSLGMLREASTIAGVRGVRADAVELPFGTHRFDVVLAPHMLYHVADIAAAAGELARVARRDGTVVIVTNSCDHLRELGLLVAAAFGDVTGHAFDAMPRSSHRFNFEDAPRLLGDALDITEDERIDGSIVVESPDPVVAYVDSMRSLYGRDISDDEWAHVLAAARSRVEHAIAIDGAWRTEKCVGVLVCRPAS